MNSLKLDKAEKEFEAALRVDPYNAGALHNLGIIYRDKSEYDKVERAFRTVYRMNPNNPNVCFMLGKVLSVGDNAIPEAIFMFNKGLSLMPSNTQGYIDPRNLGLRIGNKNKQYKYLKRHCNLIPIPAI